MKRKLKELCRWIDANILDKEACQKKISESEFFKLSEGDLLEEYVKTNSGPPIPDDGPTHRKGREILAKYILTKDLRTVKGQIQVNSVLEFLLFGEIVSAQEVETIKSWISHGVRAEEYVNSKLR